MTIPKRLLTASPPLSALALALVLPLIMLSAEQASATQPFVPEYEFTAVSPIDPGANGDLSWTLNVPAGDHLPLATIARIPTDWAVAADAGIPEGDLSGSVSIEVDKGCDSVVDDLGTVNIIETSAADFGEKLHLKTQTAIDGWWSLLFRFTQEPDGSHEMQLSLLGHAMPPTSLCAPFTLNATFSGQSGSSAPLFTNPSTVSLQQWCHDVPPSPFGSHQAVRSCDTVCIGDSDCDGWTDTSEVTIGTDPLDDCPDGPSDAAWPVDFDNDTFVTSSDLGSVAGVIGQAVPPAPARNDIDPDPPDLAITSGDLSQVAARIGQGC